MNSTTNPSIKARLRRVGIRHFDELIHDQPKEWLIKYFSRGARKYPINVSLLIRNIIWQQRERIRRGDKPPLKELIRTFWYMFVKPTLSRAGALAREVDQYAHLVEQFVFLVKELKVMRYGDIGFRDDNEAHRKVGANANIILYSEKLGHQSFLSEMADKYQVSILALGGQPSVLNVEYFVDELKKAGVNIQRSFYLFSVVDYDPSGWIVRDSFADDLMLYGVKNIRTVDLINPDMLTPEEIMMSRYLIPTTKVMVVKNRKWMKEVRSRDYENQKHLVETKRGKKLVYGLEAESISGKRLEQKLKKLMVPLLGKSEDLVTAYEFRRLNEAIQTLIVQKVLGRI